MPGHFCAQNGERALAPRADGPGQTSQTRHARLYAGQLRLNDSADEKAWLPATSAGMAKQMVSRFCIRRRTKTNSDNHCEKYPHCWPQLLLIGIKSRPKAAGNSEVRTIYGLTALKSHCSGPRFRAALTSRGGSSRVMAHSDVPIYRLTKYAEWSSQEISFVSFITSSTSA